MTGPADRWLQMAADDLAFAQLGLQHGYHANVCFLCQQAAEKALKGLLVKHTGQHPRVHNLVELTNRCQPLAPEVSGLQDSARILDQYYLPSRYPDGVPGGATPGWPTAEHAREALTIAQSILEFCRSVTQTGAQR